MAGSSSTHSQSGKRPRRSTGAAQTSKRNKVGPAAPTPASAASSSSSSSAQGGSPAVHSAQSTPTPDSTTTSTGSSSKTTAQKKMDKFNEKWGPELTTLEDILSKVSNGWKTDDAKSVYKKYKMPPGIEEGEDGVVRYTFSCTKCKHVVKRACYDNSTSNLWDHVNAKHPELPANQGTVTNFARGSTYTPEKLRLYEVFWCCSSSRPFSIVTDEWLLKIFSMFHPGFKDWSEQTISRDTHEIFKVGQKNITKVIRATPGRKHIAFDGWTSANALTFIGLNLYMIYNGELCSILLDYVPIETAHTGRQLAEHIYGAIKTYDLETSLFGGIADNAANNFTALDCLGRMLPEKSLLSRATAVRCTCHTFNLVMKAIFATFNSKNKKTGDGEGEDDEEEDGNEGVDESDVEEDLEDDEQSEEEDLEDDEHEQERATDDESDDGEVDKDREEYDEVEMEEMRELIEDELNLDRRVLKSPRLAIQRIKLIARRTHFSSTRRRALRQYCVQKKVPEKILPRPVVTRWTSLMNTIAVALQIRPAVALLTENPKHKLTHLALDEEQWTFLGHLYPIVDQFRRAIVHLEARNRPFLYEVIPGMDNLITFLEDKASDENLPIAIRAAAFNGLKIMKKYYALTDDSILPRCGIICHPGLKMVYFTRAGWSTDWIAAARKVITDLWLEHYKPVDTNPAAAPAPGTCATSVFSPNMGPSEPTDILEEYLNSPLVPTDDPIGYWNSFSTTPRTAPLARMALDVLSCPAASTDLETGFSRGGLTVSKLRHSLSDQSVRAATIVGSWLRLGIPGVLDEAELLESLRDKPKRSNKGKGKAIEPDIDVQVVE